MPSPPKATLISRARSGIELLPEPSVVLVGGGVRAGVPVSPWKDWNAVGHGVAVWKAARLRWQSPLPWLFRSGRPS